MTRAPTLPSQRALARSEVELQLAERLGELRTMAGVSQNWLADILHITPAQIENYESGRTGIPAIRLWQMATALRLPLDAFFETAQPPSDWMTPHEIQLIETLRSLPGHQVAALLRSIERTSIKPSGDMADAAVDLQTARPDSL